MTDVMDKRKVADELVQAKEHLNNCIVDSVNAGLVVAARIDEDIGVSVNISDDNAIYHEEEPYG